MRNRKLAPEELEQLLFPLDSADLPLPDINNLNGSDWVVLLVAANKDMQIFRYILARIQSQFDLYSRVAALHLLLHKVNEFKKELDEFPEEAAFAAHSQQINADILTALQLGACKHIIFRESWNTPYVNNEFNFILNHLVAMFHNVDISELSNLNQLGNTETLRYLKDKIPPADLFEMVNLYFEDFYLSGSSPEENYKLLLELFPEYKAQLSQIKAYVDSGLMDKLANNMTTSIINKDRNKYPYAKLNKDDSVSLNVFQFNDANGKTCTACTDQCACVEDCTGSQTLLSSPYTVLELEKQRQLLRLPLLDKTKPLMQIFKDNERSPSVIEYRFNLSPESLDTLMKAQTKYAYRGESSVLKLRRTYSPKHGVIRLAPAEAFENNQSFIRAAGCQTVEMPTIELLHLLPDFDGKERHFHWVPEEVVNKLSLDRSDILMILEKIYKDAGMLDQPEKYRAQDADGTMLATNPRADSVIKFREMNSEAMNFYALYGNSSIEELQHCKSIEISTVDFLRYVHAHLKEMLQRLEKEPADPKPGIAKLQKEWIEGRKRGLVLVEYMLKQLALGPAAQGTHPHSFYQPPPISQTQATPAAAAASDSKKPPVK